MKKTKDKIKKICEEFLAKLDFKAEVTLEIFEKAIFINVDCDKAPLLIGRNGETLKSLQHILRLVINKKLDEFIPLSVDVAGYRQRQEKFLEQNCTEVALEVKKTKKPIELSPMNSYERRIIHLVLEKIDGVTSESVGEGLNRRVIIKPE